MKNNQSFADLVFQALMEELSDSGDLEYCTEYGERGYTKPTQGVLFANWNDRDSNVQDCLEANGYELEWSDEWVIDYNNDKAYRTSPSSYHWQCLVHYKDNGELLTPDDDLSDWVECMAIDGPMDSIKAINSDVMALLDGDVTELGYTLLNDTDNAYECGFHTGQNDNPKEIAAGYFKAIKDLESIVFVLAESSQFYIKFAVYGLINDGHV